LRAERRFARARFYRWRREIGVGNSFAQVLIAAVEDGPGYRTAPAIEIEFAGRPSTPSELAAAVVKALSGR
jgi:hypothetical protein